VRVILDVLGTLVLNGKLGKRPGQAESPPHGESVS
jgi:hypothetical protein